MINFDDKRNFYRMMLNSEVIVTIIDDEANSQVTATCRDLSATGMAIEVEHPLEMSTHVKIKLDSSSEQVQSLDMRGKVVRVDEECEGCYLVGIAIEEVD
ncbi:MAG: PilZ domain-containing protein [Colwellia sp.]|nr:PilZ domain-containing protein [Colwellia sp.]